MIKFKKPEPKHGAMHKLRGEKEKGPKPDKRVAGAKPLLHRQGRAKH